MKISDVVNVQDANFQNPDKSAAKVQQQQTAQKEDQVTVSDRAKEISRLRNDVNKIPDIRSDRVDDVKKAINTNTYNVKGEAVAGKIIREALIDSVV
ncbi:MAG: flagellar biosynthesis anti-sigma factor FlgM [Dissulfurispiraceae bacterium]|jgi:negative regulator of flagellin synthesis FlgM|nr:flagellar biosynthesis anti-sigma factor FlgM [Dissulfurispiraceae bacterium]